MKFVEGPDDDVVKVAVDRGTVFTGTSWENYYRNSPDGAVYDNHPLVIDSLLFQTRGAAPTIPNLLGRGFLFDDVRVSTPAIYGGSNVDPTPTPAPSGGGRRWRRRNPERRSARRGHAGRRRDRVGAVGDPLGDAQPPNRAGPDGVLLSAGSRAVRRPWTIVRGGRTSRARDSIRTAARASR